MLPRKRKDALERTRFLFQRETSSLEIAEKTASEVCSEEAPQSRISRALFQGDVSISPLLFSIISLAMAMGASIAISQVLSLYFVPLFFLGGALLPFLWVERRVRSRATQFAADYPTVLLATASSIKAGLTPYAALERSTRLLSKESLVYSEVDKLLNALRRGVPREQALREFGAGIRQPDLELFRSAFVLALENGGRFAPTLKRLAAVSKDRSVLIRTAQVTTTNMRMTANFLLGVAPVIIAIISLRTEDYWNIFVSHPVANAIASTGITIITVSYVILRRMSDFRP